MSPTAARPSGVATIPSPSPSPIHILDGGLGTTLADHYAQTFTSAATPTWSGHAVLSDPAALSRCHRGFVAAGADVVTTATYQVSAAGLAATRTTTPEFPDGLAAREHVAEFVRRAVRVAADTTVIADDGAREGGRGSCADGGARRAKLALGLGPYGACMVPSTEYSGAYDAAHDAEAPLRRWHAERLGLFVDCGVGGGGGAEGAAVEIWRSIDYIAFETVPRRDEVVAIRKMLDDAGAEGGAGDDDAWRAAREKPFWISALYPGSGECAPDGSTARAVVRAMLDPQVAASTPWGIGINCTKVAKLRGLVEAYELAVTELVGETNGRVEFPSLVLYPDGTNGEVYDTVSQTWVRQESADASLATWEDQLVSVVMEAAAKGKWKSILVGGCCKADTTSIRRLREAIDAAQPMHL